MIQRFRAWDKVAKAMSPSFVLFGEFTLMGLIHDWQNSVGEKINLGDSIGRLNDLEIMQFTGMKDKNGEEIFEGDIVRLLEPGRLYTVEWIDYSFKLVHADPKLNRMDWGGLHRVGELGWGIEVTANIFNP